MDVHYMNALNFPSKPFRQRNVTTFLHSFIAEKKKEAEVSFSLWRDGIKLPGSSFVKYAAASYLHTLPFVPFYS